MINLLLLLTATVPLEYPYFDIVKREVAFVPQPSWIDSTTYERELRLTYAEDSTMVIVEGLLLERWIDNEIPGDLAEILNCDSVKTRRDTVFAYSGLRFEFTASYANLISSEMIVGMRDAAETLNYDVRDILTRLGLGKEKYLILADAGSLVTIRFKRKPGMVFMNLTTGAVIGAEMREPVPVTPDP